MCDFVVVDNLQGRDTLGVTGVAELLDGHWVDIQTPGFMDQGNDADPGSKVVCGFHGGFPETVVDW